jgi:hypothetical protein
MGSAVLFVMHCIADVANQVIWFGLVLVQVQLPMVQGRRLRPTAADRGAPASVNFTRHHRKRCIFARTPLVIPCSDRFDSRPRTVSLKHPSALQHG